MDSEGLSFFLAAESHADAERQTAAIGWPLLINPILGTSGDDILNAQAEGDVVFGFGGNDGLSSAFNRTALIGGRGIDRMTTNIIVGVPNGPPVQGLAVQIGGTGNDAHNATVSVQAGQADGPRPFSDITADVLIASGAGDDLVQATAKVEAPTFANATLTTFVRGGSGNDAIAALADARGAIADNLATNIVYEGSGDDRITADAETEHSGNTATAQNLIYGEGGKDVIVAIAHGRSIGTDLVSNTLYGGGSDDLLRAFNITNSDGRAPVGVNRLWGGDGNDVLVATHDASFSNTISTVRSYLDGGNGNDRLTARTTAAGLTVEALNRLEGGSGNDVLRAHLDAHAFRSLDAQNLLRGGSGSDRLTAFLNASIEPSMEQIPQARNHLYGGAGPDVLGATVMAGSIGSSVLKGGGGNDRLTVFGGSGNVLDGGTGRDRLIGGTGDDYFIGGGGADALVFAPDNGHDRARFETGKDTIDLRAFAAAGIDDLTDLRIDVVGGNSIIHFDAQNDLTVLGATQLAGGDFLFG